MQTLKRALNAFAAAAALLCGCTVRDSVYDPSHFRSNAVIAPPEIVLPQTTRPGAIVDGIFTGSGIRGETCCFIAPLARFAVRKESYATTLRAFVYVPQFKVFQRYPQIITITFRGEPARFTSPALVPGFHTLNVAVPRRYKRFRGSVHIQIACSVSYKPRVAAPTATPRDLGVVLTSIYFE